MTYEVCCDKCGEYSEVEGPDNMAEGDSMMITCLSCDGDEGTITEVCAE